MLTKPKKVLIGKDIDRTAACAAGAILTTTNQNAANGEVLVFDKYKKILTAGATVGDSDVIFVGQATGVTYDYTNEAGTAVTGARKIIFSDPIEGKLVKSYVGKTYTAKTEQVTTFTFTSLVVTAGTELVLRIIYRDMKEQTSGQFVHSYRYTTVTGDTVDTVAAALAAVVNAHAGRRVQASVVAGNDYFILTGKPIPSCTTGLTDLDNFCMVEFDAFLCYVDSNDYFKETLATQSTVAAVYGNGTWEIVRDTEKEAFGNKGVTNLTVFPVISPAQSTVKGAIYNQIIIEHDKSYVSSDNQYTKQAPIKTIIYLPVGALQSVNVLACLNQYMASCPGSFAAIVF